MVSCISNEIKLRNSNLNNTGTTPVNFRSKSTNTLERVPEKDTIETKKEEKKGLSKLASWGIGVGAGLATLITAMSLLARHKTNALTKLYKEKMVFKELPEKLEFKEAKTLDEALKFTKEILGIEKIDKEITLDAMNYVNRGLIDVSNANKGRLFMPKIIRFEDTQKNFIAAVNRDIGSDKFGQLTLNKKYFNNEYLNKRLNKELKYKDGVEYFKERNEFIGWNKGVWNKADTEFVRLTKKFHKSNNSLSIKEKRALLWGKDVCYEFGQNSYNYRPEVLYERLIKQHGKQKISLEEFRSFELEKQKETLKNALETKNITLDLKLDAGLDTVYHEMGHLQDYAKNLKELDLKTWDFDFFKIFKRAWNDAKNNVKRDHRTYEYIDNRWRGTTYEGFKELFKNNPKKFQEKYPDLYKHLTDKEIQNITGQVSWYSQTSIGEFVAEVYAGLVKGEKYSDEVINLYKKYNGPLLPGM